jgi:hypothetical protein
MDQNMSPDGNKEQSFVPISPETNVRNKSMEVHDRIPLDPASLPKLNTSTKTKIGN